MTKARQSAIVACAAAALVFSSTAQAAQDLRGLETGSRAVRSAGMGAQASVRLKLGGRSALRDAERVELALAAGPVIRSASARGPATSQVASLAAFRMQPGYATQFDIAGTPAARWTTRLGAEEDAKADKKDKGGPSTLGWVAIGVGVFAGLVLILEAVCRETNCIGSQ